MEHWELVVVQGVERVGGTQRAAANSPSIQSIDEDIGCVGGERLLQRNQRGLYLTVVIPSAATRGTQQPSNTALSTRQYLCVCFSMFMSSFSKPQFSPLLALTGCEYASRCSVSVKQTIHHCS